MLPTARVLALALVTLLIGSSLVGRADTTIPASTISTDTIWTLAGSPYNVTGSVTVQGTDGPDGVTTLTIEPGVQVRFASSAQLTIGSSSPGALIADGDAAGGPAAILFTSSAASPAPGAWPGIRLGGQAQGTTLLRNAEIRYAGQSGWAGIWASHPAATAIALTGVTIGDSLNYGIYATSGTLSISNSTIEGTTGTGHGILTSGGTLQLTGTSLQQNAGYDLDLGSSTPASLSGCTFSDLFFTSLGRATFGANTIEDLGVAKVSRLPAGDLGAFLANGTFVNPAPGLGLEVNGGTVSADSTWGAPAASLDVLGSVTVQGTDGPDAVTTLTIEPGVQVRFAANALLTIGSSSPGALIADGDAAGGPATIVFTSSAASPAPGAWPGIRLGGQARGTTLLRNAEIRYAGQSGWAGIYAQHAAATTIALTNVTIRDPLNYGIYLGSGILAVSGGSIQGTTGGGDGVRSVAGTLQLTGTSLQQNAGYDLNLGSSTPASLFGCTFSDLFFTSLGRATFGANTIEDLGVAKVSRLPAGDLGAFLANGTFVNPAPGLKLEVVGGPVAADSTWGAPAASLDVLGTVTVQGTDGPDAVTTLTIEPGTQVRFAANALLTIGSSSPGALIADGDAAGGPATIVFTSSAASPGPGSWSGIYLAGQARGTTLLRNAEIRYAGGSGWAGIWAAHPAATTIALTNVTIRDSQTQGIFSSGSFDIDGCSFQDNAQHDLYLTGGATSVDLSSLESVFMGSASVTATFDANTFENWGQVTSQLTPNAAVQVPAANVVNRVAGAVTKVLSGTQSVDGSWQAKMGTYEIPGSLIVQGTAGPDGVTTLTIDPGVTARFSGGYLQVGVGSGNPGRLVTSPSGNPVVLTSSQPLPSVGAWNGVWVANTGRADLSDVNIYWAGIAIDVYGTLDGATRIRVNRATTGFNFQSAAFGVNPLNIFCANVTTCVRSSGSTPILRGGELVGTSFGAENLTPAQVVDARQNWWGSANGPGPVGPGSGSRVTTGVLYDPWLTEREDDFDPVPKDDGDGGFDPCTGGVTVDCDDNCPNVANASQKDSDGDGVGDACDSDPVLTVSSDPADAADFPTVQEAVDAAFQSGTRIEIFPGLGPYLENARIDRFQLFGFSAIATDPPEPVIVDGGSNPAFWITNTAGIAPMTFNGLTIRGQTGIRSSVDTDVRDVTFEFGSQSGAALDLDGGTHRVVDSRFLPTVDRGADVAAGAELTVERSIFDGLSDAAIVTAGKVTLVNALLVAGGDGVRTTAATANATIRYATIARNASFGVDNQPAGTVSVDRSIVDENIAGDLRNVACGVVSWSTVGSVNCSAVNDNLNANPLLGSDYRLGDGSPCLDHGPSPSTYTGVPDSDLDGGPRLLDFDGDGAAENDCGAYERPAASPPIGEALNLRFDLDGITFRWDPVAGAAHYNLYGGDVAILSYQNFGACRNGIDPNLTDTEASDATEPLPGQGSFVLVTAETAGGGEGTLGFGSSAERSNYAPCP